MNRMNLCFRSVTTVVVFRARAMGYEERDREEIEKEEEEEEQCVGE